MPGCFDQPLPAGEVDADHRARPVGPLDVLEVAGGEVLGAGQPDGGGGPDVADDHTGGDLEAAFVHVLSFDGARISGLVQLTDTAAWHAALDGGPAIQLPPYEHPVLDQPRTIEYGVSGS